MAGKIGKNIAGLVGLGQEAYHHNKEKKAAAAAGDTSLPSDPLSDSGVEDDEDDWVADDAQQQLRPDDADEKKESTEQVIEWFKQRHPPLQQPTSTKGRLPAPVIIPQKRPDMRSRGFVRAYAPALGACGVDQNAFLDFVEGFHKEINKHGYFNAANIAVAIGAMAYTVSVVPSVIVHFSALAVHISIEAGRRLYISKKSNSYIDEMNAYYFQPRGLYAMIMTYRPGDKNDSEMADFETAAASAIDTRNKDDKSSLQDYKSSSGKMTNEQIPEVCPLIFPELDKASGEQQQNAFKRSLNFAKDYYDRRSQAEFAARNPDSKLNVQEQQFAGSYGDPMRFDNSGVIGVATGGAIDPRRRRWEKRNNLRQRLGRKPVASGQSGLGGKEGLVKKALKDNILYLMVVNMPSDEELQAAKAAVDQMKKEQPNWFEKFVSERRP